MYTPHGDRRPSRERIRVRLRAEQLARDEQDVEFLELVAELRDDDEWWPHLWGPSAAVAASRVGRVGAVDFLASAIAAGFSQPELFEGVLEEHFGADPIWPDLVAQMAANVPSPTLELREWPDPTPELPLELYAIAPERVEALRGRLPAPKESAWETATMLLRWVRTRWDHANDHVDDPDALVVLDRVDAGERFACVEYTIVLSQALNALGIPARRVDLRQRNHHVGIGRGHVVSEAWIDDLDRWVILDGQNASYWASGDGEPLGLLSLQRAHAIAGPGALMVGLVDEMSELHSTNWASYFASATTTGYGWADAGFSPIFQGISITKTSRLLHDGNFAYPDLSTISIGLTGTVVEPAVRLHTHHPYANGFHVAEGDTNWEVGIDDPRWGLSTSPGRHEVAIATRTTYGTTRPCALIYDVR